jgi:hypothetical protein
MTVGVEKYGLNHLGCDYLQFVHDVPDITLYAPSVMVALTWLNW